MITDEENRTDIGPFMVALHFAVSKADTCFLKKNKNEQFLPKYYLANTLLSFVKLNTVSILTHQVHSA